MESSCTRGRHQDAAGLRWSRDRIGKWLVALWCMTQLVHHSQIMRYSWNLRGEIKAFARHFVPAEFGFKHVLSTDSDGVQRNLTLARKLLDKNGYTYKVCCTISSDALLIDQFSCRNLQHVLGYSKVTSFKSSSTRSSTRTRPTMVSFMMTDTARFQCAA